MDGPMRDDLDIPMPRMAPAEPGYRVSRPREPVDATTRRLAVIGGGIALVLVGVFGAGSLFGHHARTLPVVQADSRPLRTKPDNPGGMQLDGQDDATLSGDTGGKDEVIPPPEQPAPQALRDEGRQQAAPEAADSAPPAAGGPVPAGGPVAASGPIAAGGPAEAGAPAAAGGPVAAAGPPGAQRTAPQGTPERAVAEAATPSPPAVAPHPVTASAERMPPAVVATPSALGGHAAVQLAALGSEQAAMTEWRRLSHRMPSLLEGRQPVVLRYDHDGKVYYRLRTGGFVDIAQATAFCQQVRAQGNGCSLASF